MLRRKHSEQPQNNNMLTISVKTPKNTINSRKKTCLQVGSYVVRDKTKQKRKKTVTSNLRLIYKNIVKETEARNNLSSIDMCSKTYRSC